MNQSKVVCCVRVLCVLLLGLATLAKAEVSAQPDYIQALPGEVVEAFVLDNDSGTGELRLATFSVSVDDRYNAVIDNSRNSIVVTPAEAFEGIILITYALRNDNFEEDYSSLTINYTYGVGDNTGDGPISEGEQSSVERINQLALLSSAMLDTHSQGVARFLKLKQSSANTAEGMAYWSYGAPGGAAGDDLRPTGGLFVSLNRQIITPEGGADSKIGGATIGGDVQLNDNWLVGAALGFSNAEQNSSGIDVSEKSLLAFSAFNWGAWLGELQFGGSDVTADLQQGKGLPVNLDGRAQFALAKLEYSFACSGWQVMPGFSVKHQRTAMDGYALGDEQSNFTVDDFSQTQTRGVLSLYSSYAVTMSWGVLIPQLTIASDYRISSNHQGRMSNHNGEWLSAIQAKQDSHHVTGDIGIGFWFVRGFSGFINYHQISRNDTYSQSGWNIGARWEF